ncbi:MAG: hypothetical protein HYR60_16280, partial [Acidobacteria bacterium]|nr:hypothetical protein [Acidobacteriota bacterium]
MGLRSAAEQRAALSALASANLLLSGDRLVTSIEQRVTSLAQSCLRDKEIAGVAAPEGAVADPAYLREIRARVENIRRRHPIAEHLFLFSGDGVRYPALRAGTRLAPAAACQAEGERFESQGRLGAAIDSYARCSGLVTARAITMARSARCLRRMGRLRESREVYADLMARHGGEYDPFGRPYAPAASFELGRPDPALYRDLTSGRWDLSAEILDHYLSKFGDSLDNPRRETPYL